MRLDDRGSGTFDLACVLHRRSALLSLATAMLVLSATVGLKMPTSIHRRRATFLPRPLDRACVHRPLTGSLST